MANTAHESTEVRTTSTDILDRFLMNSNTYFRAEGQEFLNPQDGVNSQHGNYTRSNETAATSHPSTGLTSQIGSASKMDRKQFDPHYKKFTNLGQHSYMPEYHHNPTDGARDTPMTVDGAHEYHRSDHHFQSPALYTEAPSVSQTGFMPPPFETNSNYHGSFHPNPSGGATNFRRDLNFASPNRGTYRFDAKYPQGPISASSSASVGRLPTVKEDFASDWLADIPQIGSLPHPRFSQENINDVIQSANYDPDVAEQVIKIEQVSPTQANRFSFSRTSSTGSIHAVCGSSASSTHNTDDEDSDTTKPPNLKERRREAHTQAEQKRRDAIKKGYDDLQMLVPTCQQPDPVGSTKLSKAAVLQRSIDYMQYLLQQKKKQEDDLESLRKEVTALKIMKANYEHIVKAHKSTPQHGQNQVSDEVKFQVYQELMDSLFQSFNGSIAVTNFAELSGSVFRWLEEYCKPQSLRAQTEAILRRELTNSQQQ